jgi:hypothetical protein
MASQLSGDAALSAGAVRVTGKQDNSATDGAGKLAAQLDRKAIPVNRTARLVRLK